MVEMERVIPEGSGPKSKIEKFRISSFVEVHDPHNLEITNNFELFRGPLAAEMEAYLFLPKNLGLSETNPEDIFSDLNVRMRLSGRDREKRLRKSVERHLKALEEHTEGQRELNATQIRDSFQKLGSLLGDWFAINKIFMRKRLAQFEEETSKQRQLQKVLRIGRKGLKLLDYSISRLRKICFHPKLSNTEEAHFILEYLSQRYLMYVEQIISGLAQIKPSDLTPPLHRDLDNFKAQLRETLKKESQAPYFKDFLADGEDLSQRLENRLLRFGYLKKFFQSEGFVDVFNTTQRARLVEPIAIFAAAMAGFIAASAALFGAALVTGGNVKEIGIMQIFNLLAALTGIYIFRDRLKELSRQYLTRKFSGVFPNRKVQLRHRKKRLGELKTWIDINPKKIPSPQAREERERASLYKMDQLVAEDLLVIRRSFSLESLAGQDSEARPHLHDIMRLNLHRYLRYMDSPLKSMTLLTKSGEIQKSLAHRKYMAFLVVTLKAKMAKSPSSLKTTKVFRIYIDKDGIQNLELCHKVKGLVTESGSLNPLKVRSLLNL